MIAGLRMEDAQQKAREFYQEMVQTGLSAEEVRQMLERVIAEAEKEEK